MLASYVPRNAFSGWHDHIYDVIGQILGESGSWSFQGDVKRMIGELYKNSDIRPVIKQDIPEKPKGVASTPCAGEG